METSEIQILVAEIVSNYLVPFINSKLFGTLGNIGNPAIGFAGKIFQAGKKYLTNAPIPISRSIEKVDIEDKSLELKMQTYTPHFRFYSLMMQIVLSHA